MTGEVIVVDTTGSTLHADAEQHGLLLGDAVTISEESYLGRSCKEKVITHLAILG